MPKSTDKVRGALKTQIKTNENPEGEHTYGSLAQELDVSKGALWKFINTNYVPTDGGICRRLGLPMPIISYRNRDEKGRFVGGLND